MTKPFNIKKLQLGKSADLEKLKAKLGGEKEQKKEKETPPSPAVPKAEEEKPRRIRAKSRSSFEANEEAPNALVEEKEAPPPETIDSPPEVVQPTEEPVTPKAPVETVQTTPPVTPTKPVQETTPAVTEEEGVKKKAVREFRDLKPKTDRVPRAHEVGRDDDRWRKKRPIKRVAISEEPPKRPTKVQIRLPIAIKDLAVIMKLKASELIQKLFLHGITATLNDVLDDETLIQFLGVEFGCEIVIDRSIADRMQVIKETVQQEIGKSEKESLKVRPPVVTFMGHVDHGKTSLIDAIRKSNMVAHEAGAITQHIGAFRCKTPVGDLTILDTPGHEAFSAMRSRGASVTDIVVLVVAGDEGMREQTYEAMQQAKAAQVTIVIAINKCDRPNFNAELVYRQLSEVELLPEVWGGQTITVNTSATTGKGIDELLQMLAMQAEVLDLKANPATRARGIILESELHKGMGAVATILIQNGTLKLGDAYVIDHLFGRVKTMQDEHGKKLEEAGPSTPLSITGLSGVPKAGDFFVVVKNEKEAREVAQMRALETQATELAQKKPSISESMLAQQEEAKERKVLKVVIKADVQGSLEALKAALLKIKSKRVTLDVIFAGVGEINESDLELAVASKAVIIGFHSQVESHAARLSKEKGVTMRMHDIIYHAVDDVKELMAQLLPRIEEEKEVGRAEVKALFKMGGVGMVVGCMIVDGAIQRSLKIRLEREGKVMWKGNIASLKRVKEDVREVKKGLECGILLENPPQVEVGDTLVAYEIIYHAPELS